MAQTLRLKRSSVAGRVPTTATLQTGEIAINTADGLVYIRKDDDSIIPLIGVNTAPVTGSVILLGSIEATSFTGSFSGDFSGSINATLSKSISNGAGIVTFTFDGSDNVTVSLDTGSAHFVDGVNNLIGSGTALSASYATSASHAEDADSATSASYSVSASYAENANAAQTAVTASYTLIAQQVLGLETGSFVVTGSVTNDTITLNQAIGTSFDLTVDNVQNATSASYAVTSSFASASISSSYAFSAFSASNSTFSTFATNAGKVLVDIVNTSPYRHYLTFVTGGGYNIVSIDQEVLSYVPDTNELDFKGDLIVSGNINLTGVVVGDDTIINDWGSVSASLAAIQVGANNLNLQQVTDNGSSTTNSITAPSFTGSLFGTASYALVAETALNVDTGSLLVTGSINDATLTFTKGDGTTFDLTVDNVASASYATYAANVLNLSTGSFMTTGSVSNATLTFTKADSTTFDLTITNVESASYAATASSADSFEVRNNATVGGDLTVAGIVTAQEFHTEFISASIIYQSGSTKFGDTADDTHEFTGSVLVSGSIDSDDITIDVWGSVSASLALISSSAASITLQQVTDNGNVTTLPITASNLNIDGFPDVSASLAAISASAANAYGLTLQQVTDNGNQTTNHVSISSSLNVSQSIYSKGEEVLDFAIAMAIALG